MNAHTTHQLRKLLHGLPTRRDANDLGDGKRCAVTALLDDVGITLNKNTIADDTRKPMDPSGIRFGTPAITTRGFREKDCARVAELMLEALKNRSDEKKLKTIQEEIKTMCKKHPVPEKFV